MTTLLLDLEQSGADIDYVSRLLTVDAVEPIRGMT